MEVKEIILASVLASSYAVGVILFAPISFLLFQVRLADALIPLSVIFGWPAVFGVTLGNIVANVYGGLGYIDIIGGSIANFIAAFVGWKIASRKFTGSWFTATIAQNIIVSSIVGSYLAVLFDVPLEVGFLGVLLGSIISMNIIGYALVLAIKKSGVQTTLWTKHACMHQICNQLKRLYDHYHPFSGKYSLIASAISSSSSSILFSYEGWSMYFRSISASFPFTKSSCLSIKL